MNFYASAVARLRKLQTASQQVEVDIELAGKFAKVIGWLEKKNKAWQAMELEACKNRCSMPKSLREEKEQVKIENALENAEQGTISDALKTLNAMVVLAPKKSRPSSKMITSFEEADAYQKSRERPRRTVIQ